MNAGEARALAAEWVFERVRAAPGEILAAFLYGSINGLADADPFPPSSDVDVALVVAEVDPARHETRKHTHRGLAIDGWWISREQLRDADAVLGDFALGPHLFDDRPVLDPEGILARLRPALRDGFARRTWIRKRCASLLDHARQFLVWAPSCPELEKANGVVLHVQRCLAQATQLADLRRPTTKKALLRAGEVLSAYGLAERHAELLALSGADRVDGPAVLALAANAARAVREAAAILRTPFPPALFVNEHALPVLEQDVPAWVAGGHAAEAFAWAASLYSFSLMAMQLDAPELRARWLPTYGADLAPAGLARLEETRARLARCPAALDAMSATCQAILAACPRAED